VPGRPGVKHLGEYGQRLAYRGGIVVDDVVDGRPSCSSASTVAAATSSRWIQELKPPPLPMIG
jgi:hypothetical protein